MSECPITHHHKPRSLFFIGKKEKESCQFYQGDFIKLPSKLFILAQFYLIKSYTLKKRGEFGAAENQRRAAACRLAPMLFMRPSARAWRCYCS